MDLYQILKGEDEDALRHALVHVDVNEQIGDGETPLFIANNLQFGETPLFIAARNNRLRFVQILLEAGDHIK